MAKLLIVESPGKLKTLRKILGHDWILEASVGHTTELAHDGPKKLGFDIRENQVETRYIARGDRGKQVLSKLRNAAKNVDQVYLAMDPDREGEAIAWHLVEQLRLKRFVRISYTQITESAVKAAIAKPRALDLPLIHAQRARQCLDKLVGYEVSPLLWNTTGGKSAGRVQSATLHLVCERERERLRFVPEDYWTLQALYNSIPGQSPQIPALIARYEPVAPSAATGARPLPPTQAGTSAAPAQNPEDRSRISSAAEAKKIEAIAKSHPHIVSNISDREEKRLPLPPLITSSLQQTAGVRFKFAPQKTMKIAQELYEGVGGNSGLITYMRTDAVTLSPEFIQEARAWLTEFAPQAMADKPPVFRTKADAQAAHEAIRPTQAALTPEKARQFLNADQYSVYKLIWERAIASQCKPATLSRGQIEIFAGSTRWVARGLRILDPGYLLFWQNTDEERELPQLKVGQELPLKEIKTERKTTQPPSRYSEAKLVQLMEKLGIGRPSTYASTVMTLLDRDYVILDKSVLAPTDLGMSTDDVVTSCMPDLVDIKFTAQMENSLDQIAENKVGWEKFLCEWNTNYLQTALVSARGKIREMPAYPKPASSFAKPPFKKFAKKRSGSAGGWKAKSSAGTSAKQKKFSGARKAKAKTSSASTGTTAPFAGDAKPSRPTPSRSSKAGRDLGFDDSSDN